MTEYVYKETKLILLPLQVHSTVSYLNIHQMDQGSYERSQRITPGLEE